MTSRTAEPQGTSLAVASPERRYPPLPAPSEVALSPEPFPNAPPGFAVKLVLALRRFLTGLADKLAPAELVMFDKGVAGAFSHVIATCCRLGIPDTLGEAPMSAEELAKALSLNADSVRRVLRALSARGVFRLRSDGRFEHTRLSRVLKGGRLGREREFIIYFNSGSNMQAWSAVEHPLRTGDSPFDHEHGMSVWDWFDAHPDEREMFAHAMMGITVMDAPTLAALYPFSEIKHLCDVGGGRGTLLSEILIRHPHLSGTLVEGEGVLASAKKLFAARGVEKRVQLVKGSFFESVPAKADAFLLKNILHDWDDGACEVILKNVRAAAVKGNRVLIVEYFVPTGSQDHTTTAVDLQMMVACTRGRERSEEELRALLVRAGIKPGRVFRYPTMGVVEGIVE